MKQFGEKPGRILKFPGRPGTPTAPFDQIWYWEKRLPLRKEQRCRVLKRNTRLHQILVEFPDGFKLVADAYAVRPTPDPPQKRFDWTE